jgi:hypothetical protein
LESIVLFVMLGEKNKLISNAAGELMDLSFPGKGKQRFRPCAASENPAER